MQRRQFIKSAVATTAGGLLVPALAESKIFRGFDTGQVWRANGQNMRVTVIGFANVAFWSCCTRTRHYSNVPFRYARFVLATFYQTGITPIADIDLPFSYEFQMGLEYPFNNTFSGIPTRQTITFGGSSTATFITGTGPHGYILSDVVDFGAIVPAGTFFGLWTTIENIQGASSPSNTIPYQINSSDNYSTGYERYQGATFTSSSQISSTTALTATSITPFTSTQSGNNAGFTPAMMLIQCDSSYKSVVMIGDSIGYGSDEGYSGSGTYGDSMGSALGNAGYCARWVFETLGLNMVNLGRGGDGFVYSSSTNWQYRLQLLALANATHVLSENVHNDVSNATGSAASISNIANNMANGYALINAATGGVPIIQACCTPGSSSTTNNWINTSGQTATNNWGSSSSVRGQINNNWIRKYPSPLGAAGYIDVNPVMEYGYSEGVPSSETSLWNVTGSAYGYTYDGVHPVSYAHYLASTGLVAYRNGSLVTNPFT